MTYLWAKKDAVKSPDSVGVEKQVGRTWLGKEKQVLKPNRSEPLQSDSIKGKKALARVKALINSHGTSRAAKEKIFSLNHHNQGRSAQSYDGDQGTRVALDFQFTTTLCP